MIRPETLFQLHRIPGRVPYARYRDWQAKLKQLRMERKIPNQLILLEHEPIYTTGRKMSWKEHLRWTPDEIETVFNTKIHTTDRGGDITFHGPGTLMIYVIADLQEMHLTVREYVDKLEDVLINAADDYGVKTEGRREGMRGVWTVGPSTAKLGAIGIAASRYITTHGAALNVNTDMKFFEPIIACGLKEARHSSLSLESAGAKGEIDMSELKERLTTKFVEVFHVRLEASPTHQECTAGAPVMPPIETTHL